MAISATQIRRGMLILFEGQPCKVMEFRHHTPGNLRAMIQTKLMNTENYEQVALSEEELGDAAQWLTPGLKIQAEFFEGAPIGIDLPPSMELTVTRTEPTMKGATVSNVNKPATLENGVTISVPPFVNEGDRIRVDPNEGRYIERAK